MIDFLLSTSEFGKGSEAVKRRDSCESLCWGLTLVACKSGPVNGERVESSLVEYMCIARRTICTE
jgi:hypothetical protein